MIISRHHAKRTDTVAAPFGSGIGSAITQSAFNPGPTLTGGLAVDSVALSIFQSAPGLAGSLTLVTIHTSTPTPSTPPSTAATANSPISIGSVIGACVGTLVGAVALIILGLWFYRRDVESLKQHGRSRRIINKTSGDKGRRSSHLEPFNNLEEGSQGMYQTKEVDNVTPRKKLRTFETSIPSRTAYTTKPPDKFDFQSSAQYHPNLAQELASEDKLPNAGQFLGHIDTGAAISWDIGTSGESSYIDPAATKSQSRGWESAKVFQYIEPEQTFADPARFFKSQNPFEDDDSEQRSTGNLFLGVSIPRPRSNSSFSRSTPIQSRSSSPVTMKPTADGSPISKVDESKGQAIEPDDDPFDGNISALSHPFASHNSDSLSSVASDDHTWQSLTPALKLSAEDAHERLRIASMQTSVTSTNSYTSGSTGEEDITALFPLPPTTEGAIKFH